MSTNVVGVDVPPALIAVSSEPSGSLSGLYLWWPRSWTRTQFRNVLWFRRGLTPKARDFNWHHVIGFWVAVPLVVIVYSGVVISGSWAGNMVYRVMGEARHGQPPPTRRRRRRRSTRCTSRRARTIPSGAS